ncbi:MAG: molecular chaperone HscA [Gammaproteobacteria bacterium]|jgi:molecular chaperone HscA
MVLLQISEPGQSAAPHQHRIAVGIDLGTTNSLVAAVRSGKAEALPDEKGRHLLPSVVNYSTSEILVGQEASDRRVEDPLNTLSSTKRLLGRGVNEFKAIQSQFPFQLSDQQDSVVPRIRTVRGDVTAVEVSAEILKVLERRAIKTLGGELSGVVITVPAYFDDAQRQATRDAATLANLNVFRLLNEPTAAAVAYGLDQKNDGLIAIYDLGGGTFDISILKLNRGIFEVLATGGDSSLGGDDFDHAIVDWIVELVSLEIIDSSLLQQLLISARQAKEALTHQISTQVQIDHRGLQWQAELTREKFESLIGPLIRKTLIACKRCIRDAGVELDQINDLVLVGGSTRVPAVQYSSGKLFGRAPMCDLDPDKVVAIGAAIQADMLAGNKPDDQMLLLDVLPLSLAIETMGGLSEKIIPRNTAIPVARAQEFTTFKDGQTAMSVHVVQGERELVSDCRSLAHFELRGFPAMVAGAARIRVTYQVDADGLMTVMAEELTSGITADIVVKPSYGLADSEIEQMLKDSMANAKQDVSNRMLAEQQVEARRVIEALDSALLEDGNLLLEKEERSLIEAARNDLEKNLEGLNTDQLKQHIRQLESLSEAYVSRRMNMNVRKVLTGKQIEEV